jgi:hypothetical protein
LNFDRWSRKQIAIFCSAHFATSLSLCVDTWGKILLSLQGITMVVVTVEKRPQPQDGAAQTVIRPPYRHDRRRTPSLGLMMIVLIVIQRNGYESTRHYMIDESVRRVTTVVTTVTTSPTLLESTSVSPPNRSMQNTTAADVRHNHNTGSTFAHTINKTTPVPRSLYKCKLPNGKQVSLPPVPRFIIVGAQKGAS